MKKYLSSLLFCVIVLSVTAQYTDLPSYEKKKPWTTDVKLIGIGTSDDEVTMTLAISGTYNFNSGACLVFINPTNGATQKVFSKDIRRETGENAMRFASYGYASFTLIFPPLPNGVNKIDLITEKVQVYGISIRPVEIVKPKQSILIANTEKEIQTLVDNTSLSIAGFYESIENGMTYAVLQKNNTIYVVFVRDNSEENDKWKCGEVRGVLRPTSSKNVYKATWLLANKEKQDAVITFDATSMTLNGKHPLTDELVTIVYIKMGNSNGSVTNSKENGELWTGTGFALADGYLVTNYHVVGEATEIQIKGVSGDINNGYKAEIVASDKVNDVAIVRITDDNFKGFGNIPYRISSRMADVGEDLFVLGYPLTQALGNEIKLTNGIISSRTGFQGDVACYQMSAPIQPGNSGGPMFDNKGNVIGIVVAGVPRAENVGYAIKTSYLKILIESAGLNIQFPANNTISTLSLAEKVKRVKNFVFYIECSK